MPTLFTTIFGMLSVLMFGQLQERQYKASLIVQVSGRGHPPILFCNPVEIYVSESESESESIRSIIF